MDNEMTTIGHSCLCFISTVAYRNDYIGQEALRVLPGSRACKVLEQQLERTNLEDAVAEGGAREVGVV